MTDRKTMSSSALRRRRQAIKTERAKLKKELREIEAEMTGRKESVVDLPHNLTDRVSRLRERAEGATPQPVASMALPAGARLITRRSADGHHMQAVVLYPDGRECAMTVPCGPAPKLPGIEC